MKQHMRTDWAPISEIPATASPEVRPIGTRPRRPSGLAQPKGAGSEAGKHQQCSKALWSLCHGGTIAQAAVHSGLTDAQVADIYLKYGLKYLVANDKHQVDDCVQIGPWTNSRLFQSGCQRFKNDFHSWHYLWVLGLTVDEAMNALLNWPEFTAIEARLMKDYPMTWREFARVDITRCYPQFASFRGPALVSKRTLAKVSKAVAALNKRSFTTQELRRLSPMSKRHLARALSQLTGLRKTGAKRGSRWEVTTEMECQSTTSGPPASHIVSTISS